jgi:hypothetical protein
MPELRFLYDPSELFSEGQVALALFDSSRNRIGLPHSVFDTGGMFDPVLLHEIRHAYISNRNIHDLNGEVSAEAKGERLPRNANLDRVGYASYQSLDEALSFMTEAVAVKLRQARKSSDFRFARTMSEAAAKRDGLMLRAAMTLVERAIEGDLLSRSGITFSASEQSPSALTAEMTIPTLKGSYRMRLDFPIGYKSESSSPRITQSRLLYLKYQIDRALRSPIVSIDSRKV